MKQRLLLPNGALKILPPDLPGYWLLSAASGKRSGFTAKAGRRAQRAAKKSVSVEIPDGSIYVDAPDLPQPTSWSCALAAASLARLYGVGPDSVNEFLKGMGTKRSGTNPPGIVNYLNSLGLKSYIRRGMSDVELMELLDNEIPTILAVQAWAADTADYDDPKIFDNGHYIASIGYSWDAPQVVLPGESPRTDQKPRRSAPKHETYFFFMDPSILCRYGYMTWTNLKRRWHDNEGTRRKPHVTQHMGIVVDPNGHRPVHGTVAQEIL
jgi:hypothetical protein